MSDAAQQVVQTVGRPQFGDVRRLVDGEDIGGQNPRLERGQDFR